MSARRVVLASMLLVVGAALAFDLHAAPKTAPSTSASASASSAAPPKKCPAGMALIPGGTFKQAETTIGGSKTIEPFCMDLTEVTVAAYATCATSGACTPAWSTCVYPLWSESQVAECATMCNAGKKDRLNHPVNCVDWEQASAYCKALDKRLPNQDEWEWAARGESKGTTFPWGDDPPTTQTCWSGPYGAKMRTSTCAVGSFPGGDNPQGVHDLAGNLQEWTASKWPGSEPLRITKGGTFAATNDEPLKATNVNADPPLNRHNALGFRCVKDP